jgi:hypothetical protein
MLPEIGSAANKFKSVQFGKKSQKEMSRGQDIGLNAVLFGSSLAMAFYIPNVEFVFGLVGATSCSTLIFTAPSLIFLSATSDSSGSYAKASSKVSSFGWITTLGLTTSRQIARLFCAFGVYLLVKSTEHTIRAVHEEQTLVDLVSSLHAAEAKAEAEDAPPRAGRLQELQLLMLDDKQLLLDMALASVRAARPADADHIDGLAGSGGGCRGAPLAPDDVAPPLPLQRARGSDLCKRNWASAQASSNTSPANPKHAQTI